VTYPATPAPTVRAWTSPLTTSGGRSLPTIRTGYEKGYEVITLSDCVAATSPEEHENAIRFDYPMFSAVMSSEALTEELRGAPVAAER
jgi:hypothetical protein